MFRYIMSKTLYRTYIKIKALSKISKLKLKDAVNVEDKALHYF